MKPSRTLYPTDGSGNEWVFVAPYLMLLLKDARQRMHSLREVFNSLLWINASWRMMSNDLPLWWVVKLPEARRGFVLLPRRWVVECSFACSGVRKF